MSDLPANFSDEDTVEYLANFMPEIREYYRIITSPATALPEFFPPVPGQSPISNCKHPKKRKRWSNEEHELMMEGIEEFGRGRWKKIAKYYVKTRTGVQIATHAHQFFRHCETNEHNNTTRKRKRSAENS